VTTLFGYGCPCGTRGHGHGVADGHAQTVTAAAEEVSKLASSAAKLHKLPNHIAFSIVPEEYSTTDEYECAEEVTENFESKESDALFGKYVGNGKSNGKFQQQSQKIQMQALAKLISWAWAAKIPLISLFDYHGEIKDSHHELAYLLQEELVLNYMAFKDQSSPSIIPSPPPTIKFHNVPNINGYSNGVNGIRNSNTLHIAVFSHEDGKDAIVQVARDICKENRNRRNSESSNREENDGEGSDLVEVNESMIDSMLKNAHGLTGLPPGISPEPDVLAILGNVCSTLGFLPWNIRLTEMHWIPKLPVVESEDFLNVLRKYSRCQQRRGT